MLDQLEKYPLIFRSTPGRMALVEHDIDVEDAAPVKLSPYHVNLHKQQLLREKLDFMLEHGLIKRAYSEWSSPVTLQPKLNSWVRFCIDFRKVNSLEG